MNRIRLVDELALAILLSSLNLGNTAHFGVSESTISCNMKVVLIHFYKCYCKTTIEWHSLLSLLQKNQGICTCTDLFHGFRNLFTSLRYNLVR
ncbi:hypothetical protein OnM2_c3487o25 [Erysiphe neolycopersici]|uniref:Secreted protein n=1 Tax=Erysiphe neolycopersici TaxID=212602 RepID=A0A420HW59_9PEZI|nr:hypothetical protein OnM2_c3487o25 [Erysiphe neolycopersici]